MEEQKHKEFSEFKTYEIGIPTSASNRQNPVWQNGTMMTIHGSNLRKMKIFTVMDLTKNREPKIALRSGKNYVVFELKENGFQTFFGQFTPEPAPAKVIIKQAKKSGLNDAPQQVQVYEQPLYGGLVPYQNGDNSLIAKRMQETYEMHIKSLQSQLDNYDAKQESLLKAINERHLEELGRAKDMNDEVLMVLHTRIGQLEGDRDHWQHEYFTIQNELLDKKREIIELTEKLKSDATNFNKNLTFAKDRFDFIIHQKDEEVKVQKKIDQQIASSSQGLGSIGDGILEKLMPIGVQALTQWLADKTGTTVPTAQPAQQIVHNPAQNLNGIQHVNNGHSNGANNMPPTRPKPLPMPEPEGVPA